MPRTPRAEQFDPNEVGIVHLIQRCVRRTFLAGFDEATGKWSFGRCQAPFLTGRVADGTIA